MESFDLIRHNKFIEIIKNTHQPSGSIFKADTIGFRHHFNDAIEVVMSLFDAQTDHDILLFDGEGELLDEIRMEMKNGRDRTTTSGNNRTYDVEGNSEKRRCATVVGNKTTSFGVRSSD